MQLEASGAGAGAGMRTERAASAYTARNMRSSLTMMKYLARTSSEGELNKVITQQARCEGTVADRRRRAGRLRNEQEQLEHQMSSQMKSLATNLQADAAAKAQAKAKAAAAARQMNVAAEQAARVMGAVAPHRASARDAALSVVAPKDSWAPQPEHGAPDASGAPHDINAHYSVLLAEHTAAVSIRHGKYCLRAAAGGAYITYAGTATAAAVRVGTAETASNAPWTLRQPPGQRTCFFSTTSGAKLYATAAGGLSIGEPSRADFAQFILLPNGGGGASDMPSPRPFSSAPRSSAAAVVASPRPQTALSVSSTTSGADGTPLLVRIFHPASRQFLHIAADTGLITLQNHVEGNTPTDATSPRVTPPLSLIFELQQQHVPTPRFRKSAATPNSTAQRSVGGRSTGPTSTPLPVRGFDMATGTVRGRMEELVLPPRSLLAPPPNRFDPPGLPPQATGMEASLAPGAGEHSRTARRGRALLEDDTRKTAWEASHLDLSDVMKGGPLVLGALFSTGGDRHMGASGATRVSEPVGMRSRYVPASGPGVSSPFKAAALPSLSADSPSRPARTTASRASRFQVRQP